MVFGLIQSLYIYLNVTYILSDQTSPVSSTSRFGEFTLRYQASTFGNKQSCPDDSTPQTESSGAELDCSCKSGFYHNGQACLPCEPGRYKQDLSLGFRTRSQQGPVPSTRLCRREEFLVGELDLAEPHAWTQ